MKNRHEPSGKWILGFVLLLLLWFLLFIISAFSGYSLTYDGLAVDSKGNVYIGERSYVGVYEGGRRVQELRINDYRSYEFTIRKDIIHIWTQGNTVIYHDLSGNELGREYAYTMQPVLSETERYQFLAQDGSQYAMKNRLFGRVKVTCTHPDGSEEIVFRMPAGAFLLKTAYPLYILGFLGWMTQGLWSWRKKKGVWAPSETKSE